ncbi:MAG: hypothetical protein GPJ51_04695 [Candidatus Heimdallarchaeota archaeon]|nr:hypothetical protein [Candidatus Heimdallarchaeota archaeon]
MDSPIMLILGIGLLTVILVFFALLVILKILNSGIEHYWKISLIILIIAALVGAGVGFFFLIINIFL